VKLVALALATVALAACGDNLWPDRGPDLSLHDEIFVSSRDHGVMCAGNSDDHAYGWRSAVAAIDRAATRGEIVQLFMHDPGVRVSRASIEHVLAAARERGVRFVTYRELATGEAHGPALALSFDDWFVDLWYAQRDLFAAYDARVTFFVALYRYYDADTRAQLKQLAADGHDIEYHGTFHQSAPGYVEEHGMDAYVAQEIDPALAEMRADGFDPVVFAYPAGLRTPELDARMLEMFSLVRATTLHCPHMDE